MLKKISFKSLFWLCSMSICINLLAVSAAQAGPWYAGYHITVINNSNVSMRLAIHQQCAWAGNYDSTVGYDDNIVDIIPNNTIIEPGSSKAITGTIYIDGADADGCGFEDTFVDINFYSDTTTTDLHNYIAQYQFLKSWSSSTIHDQNVIWSAEGQPHVLTGQVESCPGSNVACTGWIAIN
jgi:hypothetical protein